MRLMLGLALAGVMAGGHAEEQRMSTGSRTHCLGRYLIDLPANAQVQAQYTFADAKVGTFKNVSETQFRERVAAREEELKRASHGSGGTMFVDRDEFLPEQVSLVSWLSPNSRYLYRYDRFNYLPRERTLHVFESKGDATEQARARAREYQRSFTSTFRYRDPGEVPGEPGFCVDSGLIMRSKLNTEEVTANIRLSAYPSVTLTFMSYVTGRPDSDLLKRASTIPPGYEEVAAQMRTLRRGGRDLGSAKGQELLVRGDGEGKKAYEFLWESQGRADSLEYPFLSLQLSTTSESDDEGEVIDAPFRSNEEALALWDAILGSLRLRPGAVAGR